MNISKFIKLSYELDKMGYYAQADNFDEFVKISQFAKMPSQYESNQKPKTGNPLIDSALDNLKDNVFFSGERQFDRGSPYRSDFGPSGPAILPTLTPSEFAKMEQEGRFQDIFNLQLQGGMQAQNYLALSNQNLVELSTVISKYADPKVPENVRKSFFNYVLPGAISRMVAQDLESRPFTQWSQRIQEYVNILSKFAPKQMPIIRQSLKNSLQTILKNKSFENQAASAQMSKDPQWKSLSDEFDLELPKSSKKPEA